MKTAVFGTSFTRVFNSLLSDNFEVYTYDGAIIKGLLDKNEKYYKIIDILKKNHYKNGIFVFGDPDCIYYYFKKKYIDNEDSNIILKRIYNNAKKYVKLINEFKNIDNKYILGVSPPLIIKNNIFRETLIDVIKNDKVIERIPSYDLSYEFRFNIPLKFNEILKKECKKYNIKFCNIFHVILNNNNQIDKIFRPPDKFEIHYSHEAALIVYLNTCMKFLLTNKKKIYEKIKEKHKKYCEILLKNSIIDKNSPFYKFEINQIIKFIKNKKN
jgi:hypothetical protein